MLSVSFSEQSLQHFSDSLRKPLSILNGKIYSIFDDLPENNKINEVAIRVITVISLPLSYLAASLISLGADLVDLFYVRDEGRPNPLTIPLDAEEEETLSPLNSSVSASLRVLRNPQSSPHFFDLESRLASVDQLGEPPQIIINSEKEFAVRKHDATLVKLTNFIPEDALVPQFVNKDGGVAAYIPPLRKSDSESELDAIFSPERKFFSTHTLSSIAENPKTAFHSIATVPHSTLRSRRSDLSLVGDEVKTMASIPEQPVKHHPDALSLAAFKGFFDRESTFEEGLIEFTDPIINEHFIESSNYLFTKFHSLAAIQFLAKYFTKSCTAWTKKDKNSVPVIRFFSQIQKSAIKTAEDIDQEALRVDLKDFDSSSVIPDLFKDFAFAESQNHESVRVVKGSAWNHNFVCHLFSELKDGGKPFVLATFPDSKTIGFLGIDHARTFVFDSTKPSFTVVSPYNSCQILKEGLGSREEDLDLYFGALKIDTE